MAWIADNANIFYLLLGLGALGFGAAFWLNKRVKHLLVALGFVAGIVLFWLLTKFIVTDRKLLESSVRTMADAVVEKNADKLFRHISKDFRFKGNTREELFGRVKRAIEMYSISSIHVGEFEVAEVSRDAKRAKVNFRVTVHSGSDAPYLARVVTEFGWEDNVWKLRTMEFRQPIANTDQELHVPLP